MVLNSEYSLGFNCYTDPLTGYQYNSNDTFLVLDGKNKELALYSHSDNSVFTQQHHNYHKLDIATIEDILADILPPQIHLEKGDIDVININNLGKEGALWLDHNKKEMVTSTSQNSGVIDSVILYTKEDPYLTLPLLTI